MSVCGYLPPDWAMKLENGSDRKRQPGSRGVGSGGKDCKEGKGCKESKIDGGISNDLTCLCREADMEGYDRHTYP